MRVLDDSKSKSRAGSRDITQFVAFNDFNNDIRRLSEEVLAELPGQLVEYKMQNNIFV